MPTAADFEFRVGNSNTPAAWPLLGVAPDISVSRGAGAGASDRITLIFPDEAVTKQWLRVKVLAGGAVGLASDDVFYFGNAVGEVGSTPTDAKVTTLDVSLTRSNLIAFPGAPTILNVYDFNRDHKVNTQDVSLVRANLTTAMNALKLIAVPVEGALGLGAPSGLGADAGLAAVQTTSSSGVSTTMDALASTVVAPAATSKLGAVLGTGLFDALGVTVLGRRL
jgi:hypothetical protein